jgi:hypothetical protein
LGSLTCVFFSKWTVQIQSRSHRRAHNDPRPSISSCVRFMHLRPKWPPSWYVIYQFDDGQSENRHVGISILNPSPLCHVSSTPL